MKRMVPLNRLPRLNRLAAFIAALGVVVLAGCELPVAEGPGDTTAGDAASGAATPDVADDTGAALSPPPTVGAVPSPTPTAIAALSPTPTVGSTEGINGFGGTPCNTGPLPWLEGWFWDNAVRWRDDGSTILFSQGPVVYAAEADGSRVRKVADASTTVESGPASVVGEMTSFDVSPEGDEIVYATCAYEREGLSAIEEKLAPGHVSRYGYEIAAVGVEGTQPRRLTADRRFDNYPSWTPDGTRIAFLIDDGYYTGGGRYVRSRLVTMAADGTDEKWIEIGHEVRLHPPQWSPDGTRLAVVGRHPDQRRLAIYTMGTDGSDVRRLGVAASGPSWSPDGERIAFATVDGDELALYTMAADGTEARRVPVAAGWEPRYRGGHDVLVEYVEHENYGVEWEWITTLEWSPTGDRLLYGCAWRVCVVDLDGTLVGESPVGLESGSVAAWSPDGSRIAVGLGVIWPPEDTEREQRDGQVALYSMAPDGTDLRILVVYSASGRAGPLDVTGCVSGIAVPDPDLNPGLVGDCETLLLIRNRVAGVAGLDWSGYRPISEWSGVYVGGSPRRVQGLTLRRRGLDGRIPPELSMLTQLEELDMSLNGMVGEIPSEMSSLKNLQRLDLSSNHLSGEIPPELGKLAKLTHVLLQNNYLGGVIPRGLGDLSEVEYLKLSGNRLTGCIPAGLREVENTDVGALGLPDC